MLLLVERLIKQIDPLAVKDWTELIDDKRVNSWAFLKEECRCTGHDKHVDFGSTGRSCEPYRNVTLERAHILLRKELFS